MASSSKHPDFVLGIDMGTTTVKVALINQSTREVVQTISYETHASVHSDLGSMGNEQDPQRILNALQTAVSGLSKEKLVRVRRVGISGQMHGVVLWKRGEGWSRNQYGRYSIETASALYTWQDGRCTEEFLSTLPKPTSHLRLASGHGCATLFWLARERPDTLAKYDRASTIQDLVVAMICELDIPVMSVHNAAGWGYFDTVHRAWNTEILSEAGFPTHLLPTVVRAGESAGCIQSSWYGIPEGTPVGAAFGDLQCSILSCSPHSEDAVLNISTSAQLAFPMLEGFIPPESDNGSPIEYFPYFNGRYVAVAASLTGGNVMASFVKLLQQWTHELGLGVPESKIWETLMQQDTEETDLRICPIIFGERHNPSERASVTNITNRNTTLGSVFFALCQGVIANLHSMMSQHHLLAAGIKRIVCSGRAATKNPLILDQIRSHYKMPIELCQADAAVGAANAILNANPPA